MGGMEIFWILLLAMMVLPFIQTRLLKWNRQRAISNLESERGSRVILLVHRQESMKLLGIPIMRYIDINDSEEILKAIHMTDESRPIDLVLHTPGGLVLPSMQIARALNQHPAEVTVFVPHYAMSGGTLIAIAADRVVMSQHAVLGPVDPQIAGKPAASIKETVKTKPLADLDDETLIHNDVGQKAMRQLFHTVVDLLPESMSDRDKRALSDVLTRGSWTHDYPLFVETLQEFGLNVSKDMPDSILDLMSLYRQPLRQEGGVEYLPTPRTPSDKGRSDET